MQTLYKYTNLNHLDDILENQYLYCSEIKYFDDIYDGKMPFGYGTKKLKITKENVKEILKNEVDYLFTERNVDNKKIWEKIVLLIKEGEKSNESNHETSQDSEEDFSGESKEYRRALNFFTNKKVVQAFQKYIKIFIEYQDSLRICSLSDTYSNQILWLMYANNFRGICLEYEIPDGLAHKVKYRKRNLYDPLFELMKAYFYKRKITSRTVVNILNKLVETKDNTWSFQNEYRVIKHNQDSHDKEKNKFIADGLRINHIYLGYKLTQKEKEQIKEKYGKDFIISEMHIDHYKQEITFKFINDKNAYLDLYRKRIERKSFC